MFFPVANPLSDCVRKLMGPRDVIIAPSDVAVRTPQNIRMDS